MFVRAILVLLASSAILSRMGVAGDIIHCNSFESCIPGTTDPVTVSVEPANGNDDVPVVQTFSFTFSQPMDPATINSDTITLRESASGIFVNGVVSLDFSGRQAFLAVEGNLDYQTPYIATVRAGESGVLSLDGNPLLEDEIVSFTTSMPNSSVLIPSESTSQDGLIEILFARSLDADTVSRNNIKLFNLTANQPANAIFAWEARSQTVTIIPVPKLESFSDYSVTIETSLLDFKGNPYPQQTIQEFTVTGNSNSGPDVTIGREGDKGHSLYYLEGSNPLMITSVSADSVSFTDKSSQGVAYSIEGYDSSTDRIYIRPSNYLSSVLSPYTISVTSALTDLARNGAAPNSSQFAIESIQPNVVQVVPADLSEGVAQDTTVIVTFDEPMDEASLDASSFQLLDQNSIPVPGVLTSSEDKISWLFTPDNDLFPFSLYRVRVTVLAADTAGNSLESEFESRFTTAE